MIALTGGLIDVIGHRLVVRPDMGGRGVGLGHEPARFQRRTHLLHVPGRDAVGDMVDGRPAGRRDLSGQEGIAAAADDVADIARQQFDLAAFVKGTAPAQQIGVEGSAALVIAAAIREVVEPHGFPPCGRERRWRGQSGGCRLCARGEQALVVADLQVPAVGILDPEALERTPVVRHRVHAAPGQVRRHAPRIPWTDHPGKAADRRARCRPAIGAGAERLRRRGAEDATAQRPNVHDGLPAVIVPQGPAQQGSIESRLSSVVHHIDGEAFQSCRLPAGRREQFRDRRGGLGHRQRAAGLP